MRGRRRRHWLVALLTFAIAVSAIDGWAFWTAPGSVTAAVSSGSLVAATISTPASATNSLTVTWTQQASLSPTSPASSSITYSVERKLGGGSYAAVPSGGCSGTKAYGTTSCVDAPAAGGSYSYRVLAALATWTATSSASGPVTLTIDTTPPVVSSITRTGASPSNAASLSWTVTFSEAVTGVDAGDFALARTGGLTGGAISAVSGSATSYTVTSSTGSGDGTIGLNLVDDDSIVDIGANRLGGTGTANGNLTGAVYAIDKTGPVAVAVARVGAATTNLTTVSWTVTFNEAVSGVDSTDFTLVATGPTGASIGTVTGSGTTYTVTAATGSGDGTLGLNLVDDDTIIDGPGNPLGGTGSANGNVAGQTFTIDKTAPSTTSIVRASASPTNAANLSWTVTFSEAVTGVDSADFALAATGPAGASIGTVTGSATTWTVTSTSGTGDGTLGLNLVDNDSIVDVPGNKLGGTGAGNGNLAGQLYTIDKTAPAAPTLVAVTSGGPVLGALTCGIPASTRFINGGGASSVGVTATIAAPLVAGQTVSFSAVSGGVTVASTAVTAVVGANTATLDLSGSTFPEGSVTLTAKTQDAVGNESASAPVANIVKDVTAAALSGLSYADAVNVLGARDQIRGTSECGARIAALQTVGGSTTYTLTVGPGNTFALDVTSQVLSAYSYNVTATDLAGNASAITVVAGTALL